MTERAIVLAGMLVVAAAMALRGHVITPLVVVGFVLAVHADG